MLVPTTTSSHVAGTKPRDWQTTLPLGILSRVMEIALRYAQSVAQDMVHACQADQLSAIEPAAFWTDRAAESGNALLSGCSDASSQLLKGASTSVS